MPGFRVHKNNSGSSNHYPFIIDVQADILSVLETRLAIPLVASKELAGKTIRNLNPTISIGQTSYVVLTQQMAAIPRAVLGEQLDIEVDRGPILSSIDFLITGI